MPGPLHPNVMAILSAVRRLQAGSFAVLLLSHWAVWFLGSDSVCSPVQKLPLNDSANVGIILSVSLGSPARDCMYAETSLKRLRP